MAMAKSIVAIAGVMTVSLHSYHGKCPVLGDSMYTGPPNFETRHLKQLSDVDVETIAAAYKTDEQPFQKIDLKTVYAVATGELNNISKLQQEKVQTWLGKQIFAIAPQGSMTPLLYTPAPASMMRWGDPAVLDEDEKLDRVQVPIIPYNAQVRLTTLERIVDDDSTGKEGANSEDLNRDLRHEIMTVAHCMRAAAPCKSCRHHAKCTQNGLLAVSRAQCELLLQHVCSVSG